MAADEERALAELLAERAILRVILDYGRGVDEGDWASVRACFHPDATITYGTGPTRSRDETVAWLEEVMPMLHASSHYFGPPLVDLAADGASAACQTWCLDTLQFHRDAKGRELQRVSGLLYTDRFERRDGVWRIATRRNHAEWTFDVDGNTRLPPLSS